MKNANESTPVNDITLGVNDAANKLVYNVDIAYLSPEAARWKIEVDAKKALVQSATDLYDATTAQAVANAWNAVGVTN